MNDVHELNESEVRKIDGHNNTPRTKGYICLMLIIIGVQAGMLSETRSFLKQNKVALPLHNEFALSYFKEECANYSVSSIQ